MAGAAPAKSTVPLVIHLLHWPANHLDTSMSRLKVRAKSWGEGRSWNKNYPPYWLKVLLVKEAQGPSSLLITLQPSL